MQSTQTIHVPPGLKGVLVADTMIGSVRGSEGFYHYREHDATSLAAMHSLESIWKLVVDGALPLGEAKAEFAAQVGQGRVLRPQALEILPAIARGTSRPHLALIAALPSLLADNRPTLDTTPIQRREDVLRIAAAFPTLLATVHAIECGRSIPTPNPGLSHAEDWLTMATGTHPTAKQIRAVETYLSATIDHGFNASTFATRVVTSTGADLVSAIVAGLGALSGPLHGGAPSRVLSMLEAIGDPANAENWVRARLDRGERIMGFGHAVYRAEDPRSQLLKEVALGFDNELVARAVAIEERILSVMRSWRPKATIVTNVEFYAGIVLHLAGLAPSMFTPTFMVSRVIGWSAHILEQAANNKIIRPSARYIGRQPTPRA